MFSTTDPAISISDSGSTFYEGAVYTLNTSVSYAAGEVDPVKGWTIDWGDGQKTNAGGSANGDPGSFTHNYTATGFYTVTASTIDGSFTGTRDVEAEYDSYTVNSRITVTPTGWDGYELPPPPVAGTAYSLTATYTDPAGHAVTGWIISWGDGTVEQSSSSDSTTAGSGSGATSTATNTFTHTYADSDTSLLHYDITIWAGTSENWYVWYDYTDVTPDVTWADNQHDVLFNPVSGVVDTYSATVLNTTDDLSLAWGDGSTSTFSPDDSGNEVTDDNHQYQVTGDYIATLTHSTDDTVSHFVVETPRDSITATAPADQVVSAGGHLSGTIPYANYAPMTPSSRPSTSATTSARAPSQRAAEALTSPASPPPRIPSTYNSPAASKHK